MRRLAFYLTFGSAASILFSIALSQILLGAAVVALLWSRAPVRFPPIKLPLALLFGWTLVSSIHSGDFIGSLPQIKKFFVFAIALAVCSCFPTLHDALSLIWVWAPISVISACVGIYQLWVIYQQAHAEGATYYEYFLDARLHGLAGHWMTFGGELMIVALLLLSVSIWGDSKIQRVLALFCFLFLWAALALGLTRGIFLIGVPLGAAYLLLSWRMWTVAAIPAIILVSALLMPFQVRERVLSVLHPHGNDDSNNRRIILVRTGLNMIRAHPFLGVGPEQVGKQFHSYVPADVPRPLPKGWYGHLHNVYLQYAAERGLPALVLLLWILARILRDLSAEARAGTKSAAAWLIQGSVAVTLAVMGEGVFEHNLGDSEVLTMFLVTISCAYVIKWQQIGPLVTPLRAAVSRPLRERTALARPRAG